jgi:hypothetical protein
METAFEGAAGRHHAVCGEQASYGERPPRQTGGELVQVVLADRVSPGVDQPLHHESALSWLVGVIGTGRRDR